LSRYCRKNTQMTIGCVRFVSVVAVAFVLLSLSFRQFVNLYVVFYSLIPIFFKDFFCTLRI